ncbi:putative Ig domain-containing protein, partial [Micromonospora qiuiae]|uniref:putative Ig domain-containing protein n=1 Tax=Micromonospora qiuiae TaxID=502268 RepID=UPI001EF1B6AE
TPSTAGSHTFGIRLTDQHGFHADHEVTVVIAAPATAITSGEPPRGTVGTRYSFRFTAEGDSDIRFSVAAGFLPPGLTLDPDGRLSGRPEIAGSFPVTVRAAGTATSATEELSLVVAAALSEPTSTPTPAPTAAAIVPMPAPTEPSATPTEVVPTTPAAASPSPEPQGSWWLPTTGSNSALVLMLLSVVAFSIGGILLVLTYNRRRFTTPE